MTPKPRRGDIWTLAGGGDRLTSKPRPVLVLTSDIFEQSDYVTVLLLTSQQIEGYLRVPVIASRQTGINSDSMIQCDKFATVLRANLRQRCGYVSPSTMSKVREVVSVYFGFVG